MDVKVGDGVASVVIGDAMIELWQRPASLPRWKFMMDQRRVLLAKYEEGFIGVSLILASSSPPDGPLRAIMQEDFRTMGTKLRRMVVVPLGNSIWQSLVRTIVRGILLVSGRSKQQVVASSIAEGITRAMEVAGPATPSRTALREATNALAKALRVDELEAQAS
jgi:hypothetical protein